MSIKIFDLPGPQIFFRNTDRKVREGQSLFIHSIDRYVFELLLGAIEKYQNKHETYYLRKIYSSKETPAVNLYHELSCKCSLKDMDFEYLYSLDKFRGNLFLVAVQDEESLQQWIDYICKFSEFTRSAYPGSEKSIFILANPFDIEDDHTFDPGIEVINAKDIISKYDIQIYVDLETRFQFNTMLARHLYITLISELSNGKIKVCEDLLGLGHDLRNLMNPSNPKLVCEESFQDTSKVRFAIWRAQVQILFPEIEMFRQKIIEEHKSTINLPHVNEMNHRNITELHDMELSDIYFQARHGIISLPEDKLAYLRSMISVRNKIAHLEPITYSAFEKINILH